MTQKMIRKRDGRLVEFHTEKIRNAIWRSFLGVGQTGMEDVSDALARKVETMLELEGCEPEVEHVQDLVEQVLMQEGYGRTAKAYILYREERSRARQVNSSLMRKFEEITFKDAADSDIKRENANIDGDTAMGTMLRYGSEAAKQFSESFLMKPEYATAHERGDIHIHDLDFYALTTTCCQIDLLSLFHGGFSTGLGHIREPQSIASYASLACIAIQSNQNDQHGGQSIVNFDYAMAEGVAKTYRACYRQNLSRALELLCGVTPTDAQLRGFAASLAERGLVPALAGQKAYDDAEAAQLKAAFGCVEGDIRRAQEFAARRAAEETDRATYQAMESLIHNLNTMESRSGSQTPFSSINYGMDTSPEGRLVMKNLLLATEAGLGSGETPPAAAAPSACSRTSRSRMPRSTCNITKRAIPKRRSPIWAAARVWWRMPTIPPARSRRGAATFPSHPSICRGSPFWHAATARPFSAALMRCSTLSSASCSSGSRSRAAAACAISPS